MRVSELRPGDVFSFTESSAPITALVGRVHTVRNIAKAQREITTRTGQVLVVSLCTILTGSAVFNVEVSEQILVKRDHEK